MKNSAVYLGDSELFKRNDLTYFVIHEKIKNHIYGACVEHMKKDILIETPQTNMRQSIINRPACQTRNSNTRKRSIHSDYSHKQALCERTQSYFYFG